MPRAMQVGKGHSLWGPPTVLLLPQTMLEVVSTTLRGTREVSSARLPCHHHGVGTPAYAVLSEDGGTGYISARADEE